MAKRKRLTPARLDGAPAPLETKSALPARPSDTMLRPPIADVAHDAATSAAFTEVAAELTAARREGRLILRLPLDQIDADFLVRDRIIADAEEMQSLIESLRSRGQQTPIEVTALDNGRYGLISGWRRLMALRKMQAETPELDSVLALVRQPADSAEAYLAMVEENEIRVGLSFYERARIVARAADRGVYPDDRAALQGLFASAPRSKRSKIGSFVRIVRQLDDVLHHPTALSERAGLALAAALDTDPGLAERITHALGNSSAGTPAVEVTILAAMSEPRKPAAPAPKPKPKSKPSPATPDGSSDKGIICTDMGDGRVMLTGPTLKDPNARKRVIDFLRNWPE